MYCNILVPIEKCNYSTISKYAFTGLLWYRIKESQNFQRGKIQCPKLKIYWVALTVYTLHDKRPVSIKMEHQKPTKVKHRVKILNLNEQNLSDLGDTMFLNICEIGVTEGKQKQKVFQ